MSLRARVRVLIARHASSVTVRFTVKLMFFNRIHSDNEMFSTDSICKPLTKISVSLLFSIVVLLWRVEQPRSQIFSLVNWEGRVKPWEQGSRIEETNALHVWTLRRYKTQASGFQAVDDLV